MSKEINRRDFLKVSAATGAILLITPNISLAQEPKSLQLLKPQISSDHSLMQALWKRMSSRVFSPDPLPVEVLSNLLWAGFGINRPGGYRTAPSAMNWQDIDIYVVLADGLYLYTAEANQLKLILAQDLRDLAGTQPYVKKAPVNLIYVCDYAKMGGEEVFTNYTKMTGKTLDEAKILFSGVHTGVIAQNIYLYCASAGLATVLRAFIDIPALAKAMKLRPDQQITLGQSVGYPRKKS